MLLKERTKTFVPFANAKKHYRWKSKGRKVSKIFEIGLRCSLVSGKDSCLEEEELFAPERTDKEDIWSSLSITSLMLSPFEELMEISQVNQTSISSFGFLYNVHCFQVYSFIVYGISSWGIHILKWIFPTRGNIWACFVIIIDTSSIVKAKWAFPLLIFTHVL